LEQSPTESSEQAQSVESELSDEPTTTGFDHEIEGRKERDRAIAENDEFLDRTTRFKPNIFQQQQRDMEEILKEEIVKLKGEYTDVKVQAESLKDEVESLREKSKQSSDEKQNLRRKIAELEKEKLVLEEGSANLQHENGYLSERIKDFACGLISWERENIKLAERIKNMQDENTQLKEQCWGWQTRANSAIDTLKDDKKEHEKFIEQWRNHVSSLKEHIEQSKAEMQRERDQITKYMSDREKSMHSLSQDRNNWKELSRKNKEEYGRQIEQ
jgi:chromosome segregation ATPase